MFTRLTRETPWKAQVGCTFIMALIVAAPGLFIGYMTYVHDHSDNRIGLLWFAGAWIAVAALILLSGIHQLFAVKSPETVVEIEPSTLMVGQPLRIRVIQPGPLRLRSLHANLAGEQTTFGYAPGGAVKPTRQTRYLGPYRMLEIERQSIAAGQSLEREATFIVPNIEASGEPSSDVRIRWRIEVWGRVSMWPDFMHPFSVTVVVAGPAA